MTFPRQSFLKAFPPKDGALRGSALDQVTVDEPQEHDDELGAALDQTILPTFTTRPRRQLILIGTAGTDRSAYLARYLAMARAGAEGVGLIEYGAADDDDVEDPAVWHRVHPGLAAGLTDDDALRSALRVMGVAGFAREYMNVWQANQDRIIPAATWSAIRTPGALPRVGVPPVFGVDEAINRSAAAIVACWPDVDGRPILEVIAYAPLTGWVAPRLVELLTRHTGSALCTDSAGPVLTVVDDLTRIAPRWPADPLTSTSTRELTAACAMTLDRILDRSIGHRGEQPLDVAAAGASKRSVGDGWVWGRRTSTADVCPLMAASLALWAHAHRPAAPLRPVVDAA